MTKEFGPYYHPLTTPVNTPITLAARRQPGDPLLVPFLEASAEQAAMPLDALLAGDADRVIRQTVQRELGRSSVGASHLEDVASDVRLRIVRKLWSLRNQPREPIDNFLAYVSTAAEYTCYAFLRVQYPERSRFRNRVRYALSHQPSTGLIRDEQGLWQCESRRPVRRAPDPGAMLAFVDGPQAWLSARAVDIAQPLPALLDNVLAALDGPIDLDRLVDALAAALGIADARPATGGDGVAGFDPAGVADPGPGADDVLEHRDALRRTWLEIVALPPRQRAALLLNLRDPDGGAILHMLPSTGVVSQAGIADALALTPAALGALWERLPLDDLSIASELGLTRQQVINLRKSARARLARRLRQAPS